MRSLLIAEDTPAFKALTMTPSGPLEVVVDGKKIEAAAWVGRSWDWSSRSSRR